MKFTLIIYETPGDIAKRNDPEKAQAYWGAYGAYSKALQEAGVARGGAGLHPADTGTTLSQSDGKRRVQDGPYADTKEQLGGFFIIEVDNLDQAIEWASRCPALPTGKVEVRPVIPAM